MTVRPVRIASLGVAGAVVAGLVLAPAGGASAGSGGSSEEGFYRIGTDKVSSDVAGTAAAERRAATAQRISGRTAVKASIAKKAQILQTWQGIQGFGSQGVSVAAGPKQIVQATGTRVRAFTKSTGAVPAKSNKTLNQFFGLDAADFDLSQPAVIFDPVGKRFIAVSITDESGDIGLAMRISKGSAASPLTKKKWRQTVLFGSDGSGGDANPDVDEWNPQIGVSADKIGVTTVADDPNDATVANRNFIFPKNAYYKGNELGAWAADLNSTYDGQSPAVNASKQDNLFIAIPAANDVTVTTYTGAATTKKPKFSKNVVYPSNTLNAPPDVAQTGGDTINLGGLEFTGASWRNNKLYAAATVASGGRAAVRVFGINTGAGVSLSSEKTLSNPNADWFSPDVGIDKGGNVIVVANDEGTEDGPSLAVFARKASGGKWLAPRFVARSTSVVNGPTGTIDWWNSTGAAVDPSSPWDVWVSGVVGDQAVGNGFSTSNARVSLAKNKASIKASDTRVRKGSKVTFTVKLTRPDSKDTIKGLPVALQRSPKSANSFKTIKSGKTSASGTAKWKVKVKKASKYRTLGKAVKQKDGQGRVLDAVKSKPVTVNLR